MGLRVLSLFDGIACGMQAFKELGIPIDVYYASEIEPNAIKVAKANHPEIIEIGDVTKIDFNEYVGKVDIIIGGSPCQGFSVMGKQLAFKDERSALIKYFFDAVETIKPKYFFLENVVMQKQYEKNISDILGVQPVKIDAALVWYTQRKRLYWTNIPNVTTPSQIPNLTLRHMPREFFKFSKPELDLILNKDPLTEDYDHCHCVGYTSLKKSGCQAVYDTYGKYPTILTRGNKRCFFSKEYEAHGTHRTYDQHGKYLTLAASGRYRGQWTVGENYELLMPNIWGFEFLHGLPKDYTKAAGEGGEHCRVPLVGNGWCVPVIKHIFSFIPKEYYQ